MNYAGGEHGGYEVNTEWSYRPKLSASPTESYDSWTWQSPPEVTSQHWEAACQSFGVHLSDNGSNRPRATRCSLMVSGTRGGRDEQVLKKTAPAIERLAARYRDPRLFFNKIATHGYGISPQGLRQKKGQPYKGCP
jgi:hypothetical protein